MSNTNQLPIICHLFRNWFAVHEKVSGAHCCKLYLKRFSNNIWCEKKINKDCLHRLVEVTWLVTDNFNHKGVWFNNLKEKKRKTKYNSVMFILIGLGTVKDTNGIGEKKLRYYLKKVWFQNLVLKKYSFLSCTFWCWWTALKKVTGLCQLK